jgi:molybdopterin-guanine dinucleotide biosynthesis protein A
VLAGGRSSRFGRDKLKEPYRGMPLLHHAVLHLGEVCDEVVVVVAPDAPEPDLPIGLAARIVRDPSEGEGPLAGAHAGLLAVRTDVALLAGGDMPEMQLAVLLELLGVLVEAGVDAAAIHDGERIRPLPSALRTEAAVDAAHALLHSGARRLGDLLDALRVAAIDEPTWRALDPEGLTLHDVDRPEDLDG